jgi:thioesterase domain-containing protein
LLAIFKQVLNQSSCSLKESFFHQGGDSLLALSVISRMNQTFGVQLTIGVLYKNPTIIALAGLLDNLTDKNPQSPMGGDVGQELVCLKSGQGLPPLVTVYFDAANKYISSLVEPNRPVYTIIPQGSDGEIIKYKSVEDMASHYLDLLEKTLPGQKIVLAGFSFGGLVALEMAIQMKSNNINLDHVVIVDTLAPYLWPKVFARKRIVLQRSYLIGIVAKACCRTIGHPIPANYRNSVILRSWRKAARNYKPTANIDVVLIKSSQSVSNEPLLGWAEYPQIQTRLRLIEGNHHGIIREYKKIVTIAEWILNA